jgi:hypothetical protein
MKELNNKLDKELNLLLKAVHEYHFKHREDADEELIKQVLDYVRQAKRVLEPE